MKALKIVFLGKKNKNLVIETILRNKEYKEGEYETHKKYNFRYKIWDGTLIEIEIIEIYVEVYNSLPFSIGDLIQVSDLLYFVLHLPIQLNEIKYLRTSMLQLSRHAKKTKKFIVLNAEELIHENQRSSAIQSVRSLQNQKNEFPHIITEFQTYEILQSSSYHHNTISFDTSTFTDEFYENLETLIYSKINDKLSLCLYQQQSQKKQKPGIKDNEIIKNPNVKLTNIREVMKVDQLDINLDIYPLFKNVFQNKYLRQYIFKKVGEIHMELGLESRKYNEITSTWCINNNLDLLLFDKLENDDSFYITPNAMKSLLRKNKDLELMKKIQEYIERYGESEYPKTSSFIIDECVISGNLDIIKYLYELGYRLSPTTMKRSIEYDHFEVAQFLIEYLGHQFDSPNLRKNLIGIAKGNNSKSISNLLQTYFKKTQSSTLDKQEKPNLIDNNDKNDTSTPDFPNTKKRSNSFLTNLFNRKKDK